MVICPFFLKKKAGPNFTRKGVTLIELVIVISFIGMLAVFVAGVIIPSLQIAKGRDARRKADLQKLKNPLEDYYNDKECYPSLLTELIPYYLKQIPVDPQTRQPYAYSSAGCDTYYVYTNLENTNDQSIAQVGCQSGCGPAGAYNYGVSSSNARLEATAPTTTPTQAAATPTPPGGPDKYYGCKSGVCTLLSGKEECSIHFVNYPNCDPNGEYQCGPENPQNECKQ